MSTHLVIDTNRYDLSDYEDQQVASLAELWVDSHYEQMWEFARTHLGGTLSGVPGPFDALLHEIASRFMLQTRGELSARRTKYYAHWDDEHGNGETARQERFRRIKAELNGELS